jgi:hypothetical protein
MGFREEQKSSVVAPLALPDGVQVFKPVETPSLSETLGAGMRLGSPVVSYFAKSAESEVLDRVDHDYNPWEEIQNTPYQQHWNRFAGLYNADAVAATKAQIDRETRDRETIAAAGWLGFVSEMAGSLVSPTILMPGGALVQGVKGGVSIGRTGLSVAGWGGVAVALDEVALQASQELRTPQETALSIGGTMILGGMLGGLAGTIASRKFKDMGDQAEQYIVETDKAYRGLATLSAAAVPPRDFTLRREAIFKMIDSIPVMRGMVRASPTLRSQLSPLESARSYVPDLVETPLDYKVAESGTAIVPEGSVESRVKTREIQELAPLIGGFQKIYGDYFKSGPVGAVVGVMPSLARLGTASGMSKKLTYSEFMEEVGKAARRQDTHPIPEVAQAAQLLRKELFDKIKVEAEELGIFDSGLQLKHGNSYFTREWDTERIIKNFGNGTADDIFPVLEAEFKKTRLKSQTYLAENMEVVELERQRDTLREEVTQNRQMMQRLLDKDRAKRDRAGATVKTEKAVQRASQGLRKIFADRQEKLSEGVVGKEEIAALQSAVKDARAMARLEPKTLMQAIREAGGIRDPRTGGMLGGSDWNLNQPPTEIENMLGPSARTIRRTNGRDIDAMREYLAEAGFLPQDSTIADLMDLMDRSARGEGIYSSMTPSWEMERFLAAREFADEMNKLGVDISQPIDRIVRQLHGANNAPVPKAKAGEAGRAVKATDKVTAASVERTLKALERLELARERLLTVRETINPQLRKRMKDAQKELMKIMPQLRDAREVQKKERFFAEQTDTDIAMHVREAVAAITGHKSPTHFFHVAMASPTRARTLDVPDEAIENWLIHDAEQIAAQYHRSMVPDMELIRTFGDIEMTEVKKRIMEEGMKRVEDAKTPKAKKAAEVEFVERIKDMEGMRDRIRNAYAVPKDPEAFFIQAMRTGRGVSYPAYLGAQMFSSMPDLALVLGRNGIVQTFGTAFTALTDPKRFFRSTYEASEFSAAAEWYLNTRSQSMWEVFSPYGKGTRTERALGQVAKGFNIATGMTFWNMAWQSIGTAMMASKVGKAATKMRDGKASKSDKLLLGSLNIEPWMADKIARQLDKYGDKAGFNWIPQGRLWDDKVAKDAFARAMGRESRMMVMEPGQERPLFTSTEAGKFFTQFKSFGFAAHERILLAGIQRADANVLLAFMASIALGGLVSNIRADMGGYERKEGAAWWEDAFDRSGLGGWLMEPYNMVSGISSGRLSVSGEPVSRYQSRSMALGMAGPSVDMVVGGIEGLTGLASERPSYRDVRALMRPIPGNNIPYLVGLFRQIEEAGVSAFGATPRPPRP